jgi:hypothetical protein
MNAQQMLSSRAYILSGLAFRTNPLRGWYPRSAQWVPLQSRLADCYKTRKCTWVAGFNFRDAEQNLALGVWPLPARPDWI